MNTERIEQLMRYVEEEPSEPFNVYALAMEFLNGRPEQARFYFEKLLNEHPDYLPTYYHAAALYAELDERDKAAMLYDKGITLAQAQNNQKTLQELKRAQQAFDDEDDDW
ncbi:tetratricopeptide repeat protein [Spirosoma sp. BT702]|uniref:Tetratricopeptide repeat protein n=1 Tax=Spirosoma profusum TaxID=2771354 RepID=A0A927AT81_9BACT|nr:tetratricopeptide repeat protein [Spirosoma profusum]MBD2702840.1 tetratricopeptide repeat protein [Spirosoma profusum]